jgi:thioredoxin reductase
MGENLDCVVIGAGPAGLQMGAHLVAGGFGAVVVERGEDVGTFFTRYPRSRQLISFNKRGTLWDDPELNLRWDWNSILVDEDAGGDPLWFGRFSDALYPAADDFVRYLAAYARHYRVPVLRDTSVVSVRCGARGFWEVGCTSGQLLRCRYLVVATGLSLPYVPSIPGIELCVGYEAASLTSADYSNQRVLVLGKGNSAIEVADAAAETAAIVHMASPQPLRLAMHTHHPGGLRLQLARLLDMYQLKLLNAVLDCTVERIERDERGLLVTVAYSHADGERDQLRYDIVVRCTGFRFDSLIFEPDWGPALCVDDRLPELTPTWESVNMPGMFFAGTVAQADDFRYNVRTLHHMLAERYHGIPYPTEVLPAAGEVLADDMALRASQSSALWLQFGYLCDVYKIEPDGVTVMREWPANDVARRFADQACVCTLTLEWGAPRGDTFAIERHPHADASDQSVFLHPVVRRWHRGEIVAEHHLLEDLLGVYHPAFAPDMRTPADSSIHSYHQRQHVEPLAAFLSQHLVSRGGGRRITAYYQKPTTSSSDDTAILAPE